MMNQVLRKSRCSSLLFPQELTRIGGLVRLCVNDCPGRVELERSRRAHGYVRGERKENQRSKPPPKISPPPPGPPPSSPRAPPPRERPTAPPPPPPHQHPPPLWATAQPPPPI